MGTDLVATETTLENHTETRDELLDRMAARSGEDLRATKSLLELRQDLIWDESPKMSRSNREALATSEVSKHYGHDEPEWEIAKRAIETEAKQRLARKQVRESMAAAEGKSSLTKIVDANFPPKPKQVEPDDPTTSAELDSLVARCDGEPVDLERDLTWAYQNLGKRIGTVRPADAPSAGAWTQLGYARKNQTKFIETVNKILGKRVEENNQRGNRDTGESLEVLHRRFEKEVLGMK